MADRNEEPSTARYYYNWMMSNTMMACGRMTFGSLAVLLSIFGLVFLIPGIIMCFSKSIDVEKSPPLWYLAISLVAIGPLLLFMSILVIAAAVYHARESNHEQLTNEQSGNQFSTFPPKAFAEAEQGEASTQNNTSANQ